MKKTMIVISAILLALAVLSGCVSTTAQGDTPKPASNEQVYKCLLGRTPVLDGKFDEPAWEGVAWEHQTSIQGAPVKDDKDSDFAMACVADDTNLYIAFDITDDKIVSGKSKWPDYYLEDSIEFFIDPNNKKTSAYDNDDAQVTIAAGNIGRGLKTTMLNNEGFVDVEKGLMVSGKGIYDKIPTSAFSIKTDKGWAVEISIPLKTAKYTIVPKNGTVIGWGANYNDNDSGGRDRQLVWSKKDYANKSWMQSNVFGGLMFVDKL